MEINLTEQTGVREKSIGGFEEAIGKETPENSAGKIKKKRGDSTGGEKGDLPENKSKG